MHILGRENCGMYVSITSFSNMSLHTYILHKLKFLMGLDGIFDVVDVHTAYIQYIHKLHESYLRDAGPVERGCFLGSGPEREV
jgi:hypothetical protein